MGRKEKAPEPGGQKNSPTKEAYIELIGFKAKCIPLVARGFVFTMLISPCDVIMPGNYCIRMVAESALQHGMGDCTALA